MTVMAQPNKPLTPKVNETPTTLEQLISLEGHIVEGQTINKVGHEVRVTIIQGGNSKNGFAYDQPTLQRLASMLEGAQAYADHDVNAPVRSVRDMVGYYTEAEYIAPSTTSATGRVDATLHILEAASWLWSIIYESVSVGKPDLVGLSIDIFGSFQHIIHSEQGDPSSMDLLTDNQQQNYQQEPPALAAGTPATSPDTTPPGYAAFTLSGGQVRAGNTSVAARISEQQQHDAQIQSLLEQVRLERAQLLLECRLLESVLPQAVTAPIRERYTGRIFEAAELERDLTASQQMMAALASQNLIRDHGYERPEIGTQITEAEKIQAAFDLMFADDKVPMLSDTERSRFQGIKAFGSIREAYARATGDPSVTGAGAGNLGQIRISEHAPMGRITEADTTTASFSYLLGTSMNKRLLKDYQAWPAEWVRFCTVVPVKDFKQAFEAHEGGAKVLLTSSFQPG